MKGTEKRMKRKNYIFGKLVNCYNLPLEKIDELNNKYEETKEKLNSFGSKLAGRLDSELEFTNILQSTSIYDDIVECMTDYVKNMGEFNIWSSEQKANLNIISCWINDMQEGEYNPPHTHHDNTGWSSVMFLKVPEFVNDAKDPHKFRDGELGFTDVTGANMTWMQPKVGQFFIFQANHQHCVMPFKVKNKGDVRRSMSFNFVLE